MLLTSSPSSLVSHPPPPVSPKLMCATKTYLPSITFPLSTDISFLFQASLVAAKEG